MKSFLFMLIIRHFIEENPLIIVAILLFLLVSFVISLCFAVRYFYRLKKIEAEKNRLQSVKFVTKSIWHFIFNILSNILGVINNKQASLERFNGLEEVVLALSIMMRNLLETPNDQLFVSLHSEIRFIESYITLMRSGSKKQFIFDLSIDQSVDMNVRVPKIMLWSFLSNALKHSGITKKNDGTLTVTITQANGFLIIKIRDNGKGMKASQEEKSSTQAIGGHGNKVAQEIIDFINADQKKQRKPRRASLQFVDLSPTGSHAGLTVKLTLPDDLGEV